MKVLLVGGGGREDALAWRLAQSENVKRFIVHRAMPEYADTPNVRESVPKISTPSWPS